MLPAAEHVAATVLTVGCAGVGNCVVLITVKLDEATEVQFEVFLAVTV